MKPNVLSEDEQKLLLRCLQQYKPELLSKVKELDSNLLKRELINDMTNAVAHELMAKGFLGDEKSEEYGKTLENLINTLLHQVM